MKRKQDFPQGGAAIFAPLPPACEERAPRAGCGACCCRAGSPVHVFARSASAHSLGTGGAEVRPRRTARRPCRTRRPHAAGGGPGNPVRFAGPQVVDRQPQGPSPRPLALRFLSVRISLRLVGLASVARRRNRLAASPHQSRKRRAAPARRVPETVVTVGRNAAKSEMVGATRFELVTPCTPSKCATRLRYAPKNVLQSSAGASPWHARLRCAPKGVHCAISETARKVSGGAGQVKRREHAG